MQYYAGPRHRPVGMGGAGESDVESGALPIVAVQGDCLAPRIMPGSWVAYDPAQTARPGDTVVARYGGRLIVKELKEWGSHFWLVANRGWEPIQAEPPVEIVGVVTMVMRAA